MCAICMPYGIYYKGRIYYMLYNTHVVFLLCLSQAIINMTDIRLLYVPYVSHIMFPKWVTYYRYHESHMTVIMCVTYVISFTFCIRL
jgi:hypothetical protein